MQKFLRSISPSMAAALVVAALIFVADLMLPLGWVVWLPYVALVVAPLWLPGRPSPVVLAAISTFFIIVALVFDYLYTPTDVSLSVGIFNRSLGIAVLWAITALVVRQQRIEQERESLILQLQDALANIKTLRGLLPFCLSCKKIRESNGYWSRIEAYVAKHSLAEFTPGLCPECEEYLRSQLPDEQTVSR